VNEKRGDETLNQLCPTCGKRVAAGRQAGSLTAYLFGALDCSCARAGRPQKASDEWIEAQPSDGSDFCPKCGLQIVTNAKDGSLTGFLFQSTRCKCPPDQAFADGKMSAKFWKLKQTNGVTIFSSDSSTPGPGATSSIGLAPGATIGSVYKIIELIGRGGMGEVYLARHETLGKKCALKVIPPDQVTEMGWQRFQQEARAVAKLDHINLVRVTDLGIHDGCLPFYAMDFVEGKNLAELLAEYGPMPLNTTLEIFMQVCDGVECAHRSGMLHRDLKPANIMVAKVKSGIQQAKVLDFGLAKLIRNDRTKQSLTAVGDVFGSPYYMSPEQCNGGKLDVRSDIYSLGCTMFECLTGRPPFAGNLVAAVLFGHLEGEPPTLESIVGPGRYPSSMEIVMAKLLVKNPVERYQTLLELRGDLERVAQGKDVQPFYVSRSKHRQGAGTARSATSTIEGKSPGGASIYSDRPLFKIDATAEEKLTTPGLPKGLLLASICSLAAVVAFFILWPARSIFFQPYTTPSTWLFSTPKRADLAVISGIHETPAIEHAREVFEKCPQISQGVTDKRGVKVRIFQFPEVPLGLICWGSGPLKTRLAQGQVTVPASDEITLQLSRPDGEYACMFPDVLGKIGTEDISALEVIEPETPVDQDIMAFELPSKLVHAVRKWTALRRVNFCRCKLQRDTIIALNELSSRIEDLNLRGARVDGNSLAQVKWLNSLTTLNAKGIGNIDPVLKALAGAPKLHSLCLYGTGPSRSGLKALATCPNLQDLSLGEAEIDDEKLPLVCDISNLGHLDLKGCNFTAKSIHQLTRLKRLVTLDLVAVPIDPADIDKLRHQMPKCLIVSDITKEDQSYNR
jgi:serine/threonine protein kinase